MEDEQAPGDSSAVVADWRDQQFVRLWHEKDDNIGDRLAFPRSLTASVVATTRQSPGIVIDIGSGPGIYLATMLDVFPEAEGVWVDASEPMMDIARQRLALYGDRVRYMITDMRQIETAGLPRADIVVSSRAAHHLTYDELVQFYRASFELIHPGGWLANLDHTEPPGAWGDRYKVIRKQSGPSKSTSKDLPPHRHDHPRPTVAENLSALSEAGFEEAELVWKAYHTCLFMATRPAAT